MLCANKDRSRRAIETVKKQWGILEAPLWTKKDPIYRALQLNIRR